MELAELDDQSSELRDQESKIREHQKELNQKLKDLLVAKRSTDSVLKTFDLEDEEGKSPSKEDQHDKSKTKEKAVRAKSKNPLAKMMMGHLGQAKRQLETDDKKVGFLPCSCSIIETSSNNFRSSK